MKPFVLVLIFLFSNTTYSTTFFKLQLGKITKLKMKKAFDVFYYCPDNNCLALSYLKDKNLKYPKIKKGPLGFIVNPAVEFCESINAETKIYLDENKNESDFCVFKDNSTFQVHPLLRKLKE